MCICIYIYIYKCICISTPQRYLSIVACVGIKRAKSWLKPRPESCRDCLIVLQIAQQRSAQVFGFAPHRPGGVNSPGPRGLAVQKLRGSESVCPRLGPWHCVPNRSAAVRGYLAHKKPQTPEVPWRRGRRRRRESRCPPNR